jgi:hypothetical protein
VEGSGPWWAEPVKEESAPIGGVLPAAVMTTMPMHALVEKFICQGFDGSKPNAQVPLYQVCVGAWGYVLSR